MGTLSGEVTLLFSFLPHLIRGLLWKKWIRSKLFNSRPHFERILPSRKRKRMSQKFSHFEKLQISLRAMSNFFPLQVDSILEGLHILGNKEEVTNLFFFVKQQRCTQTPQQREFLRSNSRFIIQFQALRLTQKPYFLVIGVGRGGARGGQAPPQ